ncbi:hypothetical protein EXIGLDRAFT_758057 [Exidia glandulosa HHB12029]|uniref:Mid2 domain-containing protein n=1 Tax=Exidia glandulosa HHB12029 TaxID=1314781 RepID=A0A165QK21_EXIGL|nr:hypothetical protein EXIGLDRAFT_758057 [Exidia glandulosa HHB12029]
MTASSALFFLLYVLQYSAVAAVEGSLGYNDSRVAFNPAAVLSFDQFLGCAALLLLNLAAIAVPEYCSNSWSQLDGVLYPNALAAYTPSAVTVEFNFVGPSINVYGGSLSLLGPFIVGPDAQGTATLDGDSPEVVNFQSDNTPSLLYARQGLDPTQPHRLSFEFSRSPGPTIVYIHSWDATSPIPGTSQASRPVVSSPTLPPQTDTVPTIEVPVHTVPTDDDPSNIPNQSTGLPQGTMTTTSLTTSSSAQIPGVTVQPQNEIARTSVPRGTIIAVSLTVPLLLLAVISAFVIYRERRRRRRREGNNPVPYAMHLRGTFVIANAEPRPDPMILKAQAFFAGDEKPTEATEPRL